MRTLLLIATLAACTAEETQTNQDFAFDGTCVNCHAGLSAGHVHSNYKLRCVECHGGNDQVPVAPDAFKRESEFARQDLLKQAHVLPDKDLARFFFANGIDDDGDGIVDEVPVLDATGTMLIDKGEVFEPGLHGEGPGEFVDTELQRDLNYTRFVNPGDLRVATVGCGNKSRGALEGGGNGGCHQQTIDIVRRSIMVNQSAVINGAYYGNESWRPEFIQTRGNSPDPRNGAFAYSLDYDGADKCIDIKAAQADKPGGRLQPVFDRKCLQDRATSQDVAVARDAQGNANLPPFELAQGTLAAISGVSPNTTIEQLGAGDTRLPWGGKASTSDALAKLQPVPCHNPANPGPGCEVVAGVPDPVDNILRTFRAYYPLNYPGSTNNFNFTFGTSILPDIARFKTANPYGRGHSSGCSACHAPYGFDGSRAPTRLRNDDGTFVDVVDPTTKHREFDGKTQDRGVIAGQDRLLGRAVSAQEQLDTGRKQQKTYSLGHTLTAKVDTDACGMCHAFVTRINYAYQGMAEEEQRDQLARRKAIEFTTPPPRSTQVRIVDSWVREDKAINQVVVPEGVAVIELAKKRDADLAAQGLIPGAGGCAQAVFSEDCNNNGELDRQLVLERRDEDGNVIATATISEDLNNNGKLDLIDRLPREKSLDGRQVRYVYGGRNGSTRQMDVHFERGMHCIDCHFLQDVHGDGHIYSTNWDAIEIECDDCHGGRTRTDLITSGPNGGNDLKLARNDNLQPFFEERGDAIVQRSRVTPGVFWTIPQTVDQETGTAKEAHSDKHLAEPKQGSEFAGMPGASELSRAKLECATCHSSWIHNCMGCHVDLNLGDPQRTTIDRNGAVTKSAGENEVWMANSNNPAHINFQLLGLLRSPFILGVSSASEKGKLGPFRSSMQVHASVTDTGGHTILDNATFTTFQARDANSGRALAATSGVAMNQTMPHTTRPQEARDCATCHPLVDRTGQVRNEHLLAETYGLGTGAYPYLGDWAMASGTNGIELFEYKQEKELAANLAGKSQRFPGMVVNPATRTLANIEPIFGVGAVANDLVLIRNFQPTPSPSLAPPTLRDLAIAGVDTAGAGSVVVADITGRGHPTSTRSAVGTAGKSVVLALPQPPRALAHMSPDVSDPIVYAAVGSSGVSVIKLINPPPAAPVLARTVALQGGRTATDLILAGDLLFVGTAQGTVDVLAISTADPSQLMPVGSVNVGAQVNDLALAGFVLYAATSSGLVTIGLDMPQSPVVLSPPVGPAALGVAVREGRAFVAAGAAGVVQIDARVAGAPMVLGPVTATPHTAVDVVVSQLPGQTWILAVETAGSVVGIKLDNRQSLREKCFPNPAAAGCILDLQFMDATQMGRDPSFDPVTNTFDAADPSSVLFFRQAATILGAGKRLARPSSWETLGTLSGRRLRDSFMPGSGALSLTVMQAMRSIAVCETDQPSTSPSGLNQLGYADGGACRGFSLARRPAPVCRGLPCRVDPRAARLQLLRGALEPGPRAARLQQRR